jgi:lipopolysaccharide export system protein LptA
MIRLGLPLALALAAAPALAQTSALKGHDTDAPVDVTSDRIELQDRADRAVFVGRVHATQGDMTMDSARMTVAYRRAPQPGADPEIQRIDASGGVTVVDPSERATGSYGIYDLDRRLITLLGGVKLVRGDNVVNGARLVIDLNTGRSTVDGNAVGGAPGATSAAAGGRVTGHFTVPKRTAAAPAGGTTPPK